VREHAHPADLSIGSPIDPTPALVREALAEASDAPGYPTVAGAPETQDAFRDWLRRRAGVAADELGVIPSIGSKELVALLPMLLGLRPGDRVVVPEIAYPTYVVGALVAGCEVVVSDDPEAARGARLVWLNTPGNPTGRVMSTEDLRRAIEAAREHGAVVASDECYLEFGWEVEPVSALSAEVIGDSAEGVVALHSLSKRSNMAGYRYGAVAGDPDVVARLLEVRKHLGLMTPSPVQRAARAAWADQVHVEEQRRRYLHRRDILRPALEAAGFRIDHSEAGLYLWATRDENCWETAAALAERGILVAPGDFYGERGVRHVRLALTAPDDVITSAAARLSG
jgi:succinyldiaminopimelate transaminase